MDSPKAEAESRKTADVFEEARDRFLSSLDPADHRLFSPCASADDFLAAIPKLEDMARTASHRRKNFKYIELLAKQIQPYFDVVGVFVQSHPEFAALFWGAFRLVLQVIYLLRGGCEHVWVELR